MTRERLWPAVIGGWLLASAVLLIAFYPAITLFRFPDADDAMRLLEVRDWLGGQSWWDVGQHRLNAGHYPMHWSRLIDLPLAAVIAPATPLLGRLDAERLAMVVVPLLTLLATMALVARVTRRLADLEASQFVVLITAMSTPIVFQMMPMRIDHHGWQTVLALTAVLLLIGPPTWRHGVGAGAALAALVTVSFEGLPITAAIAAVTTLAWLVDHRRAPFMLGLMWTLFSGAALLHLATRGPDFWAMPCDAMSPLWLAVFGVAALTLTAASAATRAPLLVRLGLLAIGAVGCLITLRLFAGACLSGPFATLDPLVRTYWYQNVAEGMPIWRQEPSWAIVNIALPIVGLAGSLLAVRDAKPAVRTRWWLLIGVMMPATILACLVIRAGATANALALPGSAALLMRLLRRARAVRSAPLRLIATAGALVTSSPGLASEGIFAAAHATLGKKSETPSSNHLRMCAEPEEIRSLAALPPSIIFAPLDVTPDLVAMTDHHAIGGGYHRNAGAIRAIIATFIGTPAQAETIIRASGARYIAACPGLNEMELYAHLAPGGFWTRLQNGERFAWLRPVPLAHTRVRAWEVVPTNGTAARRTAPVAF